MILFKLLFATVLVGQCVTLPTPSNVASPRAATVYPIVASTEGSVTSEDDSWEGEEPLLEADIVIDSEFVPLVELRNGHSVRNLVADPRLLWPAKTVYYQLPSHRGGDDQFGAAVEEALAQIMANSCVKFAHKSAGQKTYLKLRVTGKGCATKVGYHEEEGVLDLHVGGAKCHTRGTIQHEFLHALGFWHEHTRPDRDKYVSVVWNNVKSDYKTNFLKRSDVESFNLGLPYDYASVMHYKYTSFAKHRGTPTLVPKVKEAVKVMGQRQGVTWVDIAKLNRLYNCSDEYYSGRDLKGERAVFGQIVEPGVDRNKFGKETFKHNQDDTKIFPQELHGSTHEKKLKEKFAQHNEEARKDFDLDDTDDRSGFLNERNKWVQEFIQLLSPRDKSIVSERSRQLDVNHSKKTKREAGGAKPQQQTSVNGDMTDQPAQNGGHENFAPQKILPELLKGVLNSDNNNERPIVIQFAIYQPVIYRSENTTDKPDESSADNKSKQTEIPNRFANEMGYNNNQRDKQSISQEFTRDRDKNNRNSQDSIGEQDKYHRGSQESAREQDKYNRNSQESNRDQDKYNRNSQESTKEQDKYNRNSEEAIREQDKYNRNSQESTRDQDKYNRNSQSQHDQDDTDLRTSGYDGYNRGYGESTSFQKQYSPSLRGTNEKTTVPNKNLRRPSDYSEIDRRIPYDRRIEYSSSFQISKKGGETTKLSPIDYGSSSTRPVTSENTATTTKDNFPNQDFSLQRIASIPKSDFIESSRIPIKNDDYIGVSDREYNRPVEFSEIRYDQSTASIKDYIQPPQNPARRGDEFIPIEKKIDSSQGGYGTNTEEFVTPIPHSKYPGETDDRVPDLKYVYGSITHDAEVSGIHKDEHSQISNQYGTQEKVEHGTKDTHDFIPNSNIGRGDLAHGDTAHGDITHGDVAHGGYPAIETKIDEHAERKDSFYPSIQDSDLGVGPFPGSKAVLLQTSDTFASSNLNTNPAKTLPLTGQNTNDPRVAKPLPAKSTEIPLEVGPPKATQPLIGSGDGENVAPNWKGVIENQGPKEEPISYSRGSETGDGVSRFSNPTSTETPTGFKSSDRDGKENEETNQGTRPIRRPDLETELDPNDELDKELRRQKVEKKVQEETVSKRTESPATMAPTKAKSELQVGKDIIIAPRKIQTITKVLAPPAPQSSPPPPPPPPPPTKKPSNPRREVQEDDLEPTDNEDDLISKPKISRVNLNPRQALPLNANATIKMNLRKLLRKERN